MPPHPSSFINKNVYNKYGLYHEKFLIASDFEIFLRFIYKYKVEFQILNKTVVRMRMGGILKIFRVTLYQQKKFLNHLN